MTDQDSISNWDLPFKLVEKVRQQDEDYWDQYRTTPKAFVSLATAKRLWGSRWGTISLVRIPTPPGETASGVAGVTQKLEQQLKPADAGLVFMPVKAQGLAASSGTTPFDALFLGFSFFLIAAAVMLISLLFKLGVEQRAQELGTLGAMGLRSRKIASMLSSEGLLVADDRRGGRRRRGHRLRRTDDPGTADLVGCRGEYAVSPTSRHDREPRHRLGHRRGGLLDHDPLVDPATGAATGGPAAGRCHGNAAGIRREEVRLDLAADPRGIRGPDGRPGGDRLLAARRSTSGHLLRQRRDGAHTALERSVLPIAAQRPQQAVPSPAFARQARGDQHGPPSGPQHAHDRPGGDGDVSDRGDQRVSTRHGRRGHRRIHVRRHERPADPFRPEHAGRAARELGFSDATAAVARRLEDLLVPRRRRRGCELPEPVSPDAAAGAGIARLVHRTAADLAGRTNGPGNERESVGTFEQPTGQRRHPAGRSCPWCST